MKNKCGFLLCLLLLCGSTPLSAGEWLYWPTMAYSKYIASPGLEACYQFKPYLGLNLGAGIYIQNPDPAHLVNQSFDDRAGFYCMNLGLSSRLYRSGNHAVGIMAGWKMYYGPDYRLFRKGDGYGDLYFDASILRPESGLDLGLFYQYRKVSLLGKFDLARKRFRVGISYLFGSSHSVSTK